MSADVNLYPRCLNLVLTYTAYTVHCSVYNDKGAELHRSPTYPSVYSAPRAIATAAAWCAEHHPSVLTVVCA